MEQICQTVFELAGKKPEMKFVIAGSGPMETQMNSLLSPLIGERRLWLGALSFEQTLAISTVTDFFLTAPGIDKKHWFQEAISSSVVNFASSGAVVLFPSQDSGIYEAVSPENVSLCESLQPENWAKMIARLSSQPETFQAISQANRRHGEKFTADNVVRPLLHYFQQFSPLQPLVL